jgi:hypothetical protein
MSAAARIALAMSGEDRTAAMFASVQKRANAAMGGLRKTLALAGVGLGVAGVTRAAKQAVDALGTLSDQAQRMGSSAEDVQRLTGALDKVGVVGVSVESLASAFGKMTKETGQQGVAGFREILGQVASLGTEQERVLELTRVMGREMGAKLAPLVRQGPEAFQQGLEGVMAMMPAVSTEAANAGDSASDALKIASAEIRTAWQGMIGDMVGGWENTFGVSFEQGIYIAIEYVKWFANSLWQSFKTSIQNSVMLFRAMFNDFGGGLEWMARGFAGVLNGIGRLAREFGLQLWDWLTGGGAMDWQAVWQSAVDGFEAVGRSAFGDGIEWSLVDEQALAAARDAAIATKRAGIEAQALLATGAAAVESEIAVAGQKSAKLVRDAAKDASLVYAGSYAALKVALDNRSGSLGTAGALRSGTAGGAGSAAGGGSTQQAGEMVRLLRRLLETNQDGWRKVAALGTV